MASNATGQTVGYKALSHIPPLLLVIIGTCSIQFGGALAFTLFDDVGAAGATLLRLSLSAVLMLAVARPALRGRSAGDWRLVLIFGLTLGVMNFCFYQAIARLPLGVAVTIAFFGPITVAGALSRKPIQWLWVIMAAGGVVLLAAPWTSADTLDIAGVGFALVGSAGWGAYILLAKRVVQSFHAGEGIAIASAIGTGVVLIPGVIGGGERLLSPSVLAVGLVVALLCSAIPYSTEAEALRRMRARVFSLLMSIEPAVAALAGLIVLGQHLSLRDLAGMALVMLASVGVMQGANFATPAEAASEG